MRLILVLSKVAIRLSNLADTLRRLGDYATAESYYRRALEIDRRHFRMSNTKTL